MLSFSQSIKTNELLRNGTDLVKTGIVEMQHRLQPLN